MVEKVHDMLPKFDELLQNHVPTSILEARKDLLQMTDEERLHFPNLSLDEFQRSFLDLSALVQKIPRRDCCTIFGSITIKVKFVTQKASGHRSKSIEVCILKQYHYEECKDSTRIISLCEELPVETINSRKEETRMRSQFLFLSTDDQILVDKHYRTLLQVNSVINMVLSHTKEEKIDWIVAKSYINNLSRFRDNIEIEISNYNGDLQEMIPTLLFKKI